MVSIRRRRQLGYTTGVLSQHIQFDDDAVAYFLTPPGTPEDQPVHPDELETRGSSTKPSSQKELGSSSWANQSDQPNAEGSTSGKRKLDLPSPDDETNPRKKKKINHSKEQGKLKGVYFKNQKWQAAIKVDKRQIHLGTFDSQVEAARLYDRAAFLCGRSPNFELPKEDIEELRKLNWDQFMTKTMDDIFNKSSRKRRAAARQPDKPNSPVIEPKAKRALSFSKEPKPDKSNSPVIEPKAKRALSFSEEPKPEGSTSSSGWLWPIVHGSPSTSES